MGGHYWMDGGGFMFPGLGLIVIIVVIVALIWAVSRGFSGGLPGPDRETGGRPGETALDVLKRRYAAGEIDKDEYERIKRDIES